MKECCKHELERIQLAIREANLLHTLLSWSPWLMAILGGEETRLHKRAVETITSYIEDEVREWEFNTAATLEKRRVVKLPDEDEAADAALKIKRAECRDIAEFHQFVHMTGDHDRRAEEFWRRMVTLFQDRQTNLQNIHLPAE